MSNLINESNSPKISIIGKNSVTLAHALSIQSVDLEVADGALFIVSATDGIVSADIASWRLARELYIPSLVVITELASSEIDFEDMTAIATKMLDPVVTPYLVLHGDDGSPAALIELQSLLIHDYTSGTNAKQPADQEHIELVQEFREEYLEQLEDAGEDSFEAGLLFPALPWVEGTPIGIAEIRGYLNQVPVIR